jgi:hypothetical protein
MGEKIELTALQLVYLLDDFILDVLDSIEAGETIDTTEIATQYAVSFVKKYRCRKEQNNG